MKFSWFIALASIVLSAHAAHAQRILEEWHTRTSAGAEALVSGAAAVFWNPAQVAFGAGRGEALLLDLRGPGLTGVNGVALAAAGRLDARTTLALGYEHVGVDGITETTTSPESGIPLVVAEDRFAGSAAHALNDRLSLGARVQYTRLPAFSDVRGVIALGIGVRHRPLAGQPLTIAAMAATEGQEAYWLAGLDYSSAERWGDLVIRGEYGVAGGQLASGITHRAAVIGQWRNLGEGTIGLAVEPDGGGRTIQPVLGAAIRYHRYKLGVVREQLPNEFGGAYSFRFGVSF